MFVEGGGGLCHGTMAQWPVQACPHVALSATQNAIFGDASIQCNNSGSCAHSECRRHTVNVINVEAPHASRNGVFVCIYGLVWNINVFIPTFGDLIPIDSNKPQFSITGTARIE